MDDLELLRRHEPIVRFNEGEYFLPAAVEAYIAAAELWERTGPTTRQLVAPARTLDPERLVELTRDRVAQHYLRLVSQPLASTELVAWRLRRDRPRFRPETRLGRVGVFARLLDAGARVSLLLRGRVPTGAQAAAAVLDRDRADHGDHPYYGRVLREAGYLVLQYWFFYFFNDWRSRVHGVNDHEGDWEQVTVFLVERDGAPPEPAWVAFSAHDEVGADLRRRWDDPDLTRVDGHPVVYAGLGSHSGAYLAGEYLISVRGSRFHRLGRSFRRVTRLVFPWTRDQDIERIGIPYVEYSRGDGVSIGPGQPHPWRPVPISDDTPWAREYTGLWGDDTNDPFGGERGPAGPRYERDGTVRRSWGDPVGWAALDAVVADDDERRRIVSERIAEITAELEEVRATQDRIRRRLRAAVIGGALDTGEELGELAALAARASRRRDERHHLVHVLGATPPVPHPHAHLSHRNVPLPEEPAGRRRVLRVWSTISTPLMFVLLANLFLPTQQSTLLLGAVGLGVVFSMEALARARLFSFALGVGVIAVAVLAGTAIVGAVLASWQLTVAGLCLAMAATFLVLNLKEARRT